MFGELADKVAVITGGASGIGLAMVKGFVAAGAKVVIADVDERAGEQLVDACGDSARFQRVDVSDPEQVQESIAAAVRAFGGLHIMVNNAGISATMHKDFLHDDLVDFHRVMDVNLLGVMLGTREAARHMSGAGGGSIVNISSVGGIKAGPGVLTYRASKAAVIEFSTNAACELAPMGIRVNCIAPGNIPTPILASSANHLSEEARAAYVDRMRSHMRTNSPLHRDGTAEDVAEAALYLAGERSRYVTGIVLPVDGGTVAAAMAGLYS